MKTPDNRDAGVAGNMGWKYRFTLQWNAETDEKIQAGDFLERLGNRKSEFIVPAINEYLTAHPEMLLSDNKIKIVVKPDFTTEQLKIMIRDIIEEKLSGLTPDMRNAGNFNAAVEKSGSDISEVDMAEMLRNLDLFS